MSYKVDNAIIMAAGTASRFAPLSYEKPKALIEVRGEVLIERQIRQLKAAGIDAIYIVVGYKKECFKYLEKKFGVSLLYNDEYLSRNNNGSIYAAREVIRNSYICSSDNYFVVNPFEQVVDEAYYAAVYSNGRTKEWCMKEDESGYIASVSIGGENSWYMLGHVFWSEVFSRKFLEILHSIYNDEKTIELLWENIFIDHLDELKMCVRKYDQNVIFEFDTLDELRDFDTTYVENTRSPILKEISTQLGGKEADIRNVNAFKEEKNVATGFTFEYKGHLYKYRYESGKLESWKE